MPCPQVFVNEPFRHYPPCPSFETLPQIPVEVVASMVVGGFIVLVLFLIVFSAIVFTLTMGAE